MPYCPKCGKEVNEEDDYCTHCRTPLKEGLVYRRVNRRDEKDEKNEKDEKDEKGEDRYGAVIGGLIVTWLGTLLLLNNRNLIHGADFGGYFLMGIGAILIFRGLLALQEHGSLDAGLGFFIGGSVLVLIGAGITYNIRDWWAFILIGLGLVIILRGFTEKNRNPMP